MHLTELALLGLKGCREWETLTFLIVLQDDGSHQLRGLHSQFAEREPSRTTKTGGCSNQSI